MNNKAKMGNSHESERNFIKTPLTDFNDRNKGKRLP